MSVCIMIYLVVRQRRLVNRVKYLFCLVLLFIHQHAGCRRPALAQYEATVSVKIILL